ncbi:type IV pilus modification PilV family protein [Thermostichus vulcanus]|uniref:Type II secretion system protein n=1 Tax=Thermostichus vulcanus str. 'Rupite' TaxID=2813851 RepID=A0ABT0C8H4_THEVL|nr:type II secretion system protein [Thermostichus vulcanus]MCJ2542092.1 type II secretion system protein [Thermostichus vulcanus str. 'Rupite']
MARLTNWLLLRHRWQEGGFSLIEVLASLIIVAIAMAALVPALTLVAYRRAMSERVEVANQLAQAEVDRIRTLVDLELAASPGAFQNPVQLARLPRIGADPLDSTPPPANMDTDGGNYSIRLAQIELPGRNPEEYVIQSFRNSGGDCIDRRNNTVIVGVPCTFLMGVRVYHRFSFNQATREALPGLRTESVSANQNLANADVWLFPMASSILEINLAADLGDVCRGILATTANPTNSCDAFPVPVPSL